MWSYPLPQDNRPGPEAMRVQSAMRQLFQAPSMKVLAVVVKPISY